MDCRVRVCSKIDCHVRLLPKGVIVERFVSQDSNRRCPAFFSGWLLLPVVVFLCWSSCSPRVSKLMPSMLWVTPNIQTGFWTQGQHLKRPSDFPLRISCERERRHAYYSGSGCFSGTLWLLAHRCGKVLKLQYRTKPNSIKRPCKNMLVLEVKRRRRVRCC